MDVSNLKYIFDQHYKLVINNSNSYSGLVKGDMGLILCHGNFYLLFQEEQYLSEIEKHLKRYLSQNYNNYTLGYGLAGLAWTIELLRQSEILECNWNWVEKSDLLLSEECQKQIMKGNFDYFSGCGGILNYFISKEKKENITLELAHLYIKHVYIEFVLTSNYINTNLGVPHGILGIILLLIKIKESLPLPVDSLIEHLMNLLWDSRNPDKYQSLLPSFRNSKNDTTLAWCYGDLPLMYCLVKMKKYNMSFCHSINVDLIFEKTVNRVDCFKDNQTLCHGSSVIALLFLHIWKATGLEEYSHIFSKWKEYSDNLWNECYISFKKKGLYREFYLDTSLFYGFPGFFLSMLSMENASIGKWETTLII